ncbi:hypothetical protein AGMMS49593_08320 [Endomicrobiia bacterium]|nr:hypothetical protein AGMMS49593_08320 [Endomicrobiia bacterium]
MSGDPAAIYMAGGKEYANALMQKEAQEKAKKIRQQEHQDALAHQGVTERLQAMGMDETRSLHEMTEANNERRFQAAQAQVLQKALQEKAKEAKDERDANIKAEIALDRKMATLRPQDRVLFRVLYKQTLNKLNNILKKTNSFWANLATR